MGKKKKKKKTTSVAVPLDPAVLSDIGGIRNPLTADNEYPDSIYTCRIWLTNGHRDKNNRDVGWLKVQRQAVDKQTVSFSVDRVILNGSDWDRPLLFTHHTAEIICANDPLFSLRSFSGHVDFVTVPESPTSALKGYTVSGEKTDGDLRLSNGVTVASPCAADWLLPLAIPALHDSLSGMQQFTMLEALAAVKKKQSLFVDEPFEGMWNGDKIALKRVLHIGEGIMPTTYWIDDEGGTALITSGYLALISDPNAESIFDVLKEEADNG